MPQGTAGIHRRIISLGGFRMAQLATAPASSAPQPEQSNGQEKQTAPIPTPRVCAELVESGRLLCFPKAEQAFEASAIVTDRGRLYAVSDKPAAGPGLSPL